MNTEKKFYHVFADNHDEYFGEDRFDDAVAHYEKLIKDGYAGVRLYEEFEIYENGEPTGEFCDESCLKSYGYWPA